MKKLLLFIVALFTLSTVHAELILHESFNQEPGRLTSGRRLDCNDSTKWWSYAGWTGGATAPTDPIMVTEGSLSYPGYVTTATGNKVQLQQVGGTSDLRYFRTRNSGTVYAAAIINMESATSTSDYFFGLGYTANSRVYAMADGAGFKLAVSKYAEYNAQTATYTSVLKYNTNYLIVLEYVIKEGTKNDSVNLYVNPTKDNQVPTLVCNMTLANTKSDPTIQSVYLRQSKNGPKVAVDEIKVATTWDELFEDGSTPSTPTPEIILPTSTLNFGDYVFSGNTYTSKFIVKGKNLNGDITLTSSHTDVTLDKTTITKAEAEATDGVEVTATLLPTIAGDQSVTVTLSSEGADNSTLVGSWNAVVYTPCATVAELVQELEKSSGTTSSVYVRFTGNAIVSYKATEEIRGATYNFIYMQDNTAGIRIRDTYWADAVKQGDEITDFRLEGEDPKSTLLAEPVSSYTTTLTVVSQNNEITPQVVTLAELKTNAANYLNKLVKVENVTLDQRSTTFKGVDADGDAIPDKITQNGSEATLSIVDGNPLVGTTKPKKADIIGISTNKLGNAIRPRGLADVISKDSPTAIENIALDMLNGNYEIYTVSGMRVEALQPGVNIIRQGDKTYKVVR